MDERDLTAERLRALLKYNPETGEFTWIQKPAKRICAGSVAGAKRPDGYIQIGIDKRLHFAHRLAFLWMTGTVPGGEIDHIDRDTSNNRWANLRAVTTSLNQQNRRGAQSNNKTSGVLGVSWNARRGAWMAQIVVNGQNHFLGYHSSIDAARAAYLASKKMLHPASV
jgi:hypothetical protein